MLPAPDAALKGLLGPTALSALLGAVEAALNHSLRYDGLSRRRLAELQGRVIAIRLDQPQLSVYLVPCNDPRQCLQLRQVWEGEVDLSLSGGPAAVWNVLTSSSGNPLLGSGLEVRGDIGLLQHLGDLAKGADIDWEAPLVEKLGPVLGHQLARLLRRKFSWLQHARQRIPQVIKEFLLEESGATPHREESEHFYRGVSELQLHTERLEARIRQLQHQLL